MNHLDSPVSAHRLERLGRFLAICGATWCGVGCYYLISSRTGDALLCFGEAAVSVALIPIAKRIGRRGAVHWFLVAITLGILAESYLSGLSASFIPTFFCVPILLAAYQLGPRGAWKWGAVSLVCLTLIHFLPSGLLPSMPSPTWLDRFAGQVAMLLLVLTFSCLAEMSAERYALQLQKASEELRAGTKQLNRMLGVDPLTDLPNRTQFHRDATVALKRAKQEGLRLAILLIDLNGFKQINDRMGHAAGDQVLKDVAIRLREAVDPAEGKIARLGGDEFTVILERVPDEYAGALTGGKIVRSISRDYRLQGREIKLGASVGVASFPKDGQSIDELMSYADAAMYTAKSEQSGVQLYLPSMTEAARHKQEMDEQLSKAIDRDEFALVYQPQVDVRTCQITGMEALLRWNRNGEFVSPAEFISFLEDSGSIHEVGRWVMMKACEEAKVWADNGCPVRVSVNVSCVQFERAAFLYDVWTALERTQLDPNLLELELTETVFLHEPEQAIENIEMLRETGASISIDDFGTGYSSLAYLKALPINRLKIDRSFIKDIPAHDDGMIAETVISLAHNLGMSVIAEGVDTEAQLDFLSHRGCDEYQGYLFSRPIGKFASRKLLGIRTDQAIEQTVG